MRKWMRRLGVAVVVGICPGVMWLTIGVWWTLPAPTAKARPPRLLITGAEVVDVRSGRLLEADILIEGDRIVTVADGLNPPDATVVDGAGKFAIPGLFDMHVHSIKLSPVLMHPLFVAAGVTAVRDMGGCLGRDDPWLACAADKRAWHQEVAAGNRVGPRYDHITTLPINGGREIPGGFDPRLGVPGPEDASVRAAHDASLNVDFLKPYTMLDRDAYDALAKSAAEQGLYLAGHLPLSVSAMEAVAAGQRSIEHAFLFIWECYPSMASLRGAATAATAYTDELRRRMIEEHDPERCSRLHAAMGAAGIAFVPTHGTRKLDAFSADDDFRRDPRLRYVPTLLSYLWLQDADSMARRAGPGGLESYRAFYEFGIEQTGVAHRAGVTVLAGTDAPDSFVFPGSGLHDELERLVRAGLSPLDALRAATLEPARFLGLDGQAGVIEAGARADIVLVGANPLLDVRAARQVESVILAGAHYDRTDLDALEAAVETAAQSWTMWPKFLWQMLRSPIMRTQFAD